MKIRKISYEHCKLSQLVYSAYHKKCNIRKSNKETKNTYKHPFQRNPTDIISNFRNS